MIDFLEFYPDTTFDNQLIRIFFLAMLKKFPFLSDFLTSFVHKEYSRIGCFPFFDAISLDLKAWLK